MNVVTTCEELAFPTPGARGRLPRARPRWRATKKVSVLATGVNPGYAMDALALMLTAPCAEVERVSRSRAWWTPARAGCPCSARWAPG